MINDAVNGKTNKSASPSPTTTGKSSGTATTIPVVSSNPASTSTTKEIKKIYILPVSTNIKLGETINLKAEIKYTDGTTSNDVIWTIDKKDIATIDAQGVLKTIANGFICITAKAKDFPDKTIDIYIRIGNVVLPSSTAYPSPTIYPSSSVSPSSTASASPSASLSVPTGLSTVSVTQTGFTLTWIAVTGATSYKVYKGGTLYSENITTNSKEITGLTAATTYSMEVSAVTSSGESTKSTALGARTSTNIPGKIVFASNRNGLYEVYIMDPDGANQIKVSPNTAGTFDYNYWPVWSPNKNKIAFRATRDGNPGDIYVMNADGTSLTRTNTGAVYYYLNSQNWSPDSTKLFLSYDNDLYKVNADGTNLVNITNHSGNVEHSPSVSPDGTKLVCWSAAQIYVMNTDGTNIITLTSDGGESAKWSPDGTKIVYNYNNDIYVIKADGTNKIKASTNGDLGNYNKFSWSPDGTKIVFEYSDPMSYASEIYVVNADGTNQVNLTNNSNIMDNSPSWSTNSSQIVFVSKRDGDDEIFVMNVDGSSPTQLTNNATSDINPDWSRQ